MNRKHKRDMEGGCKIRHVLFFFVLPRKMEAVFPPADKGAALTCILHLS